MTVTVEAGDMAKFWSFLKVKRLMGWRGGGRRKEESGDLPGQKPKARATELPS